MKKILETHVTLESLEPGSQTHTENTRTTRAKATEELEVDIYCIVLLFVFI